MIGSCGSSCFRAVFPAFCPLSCFAIVWLLANMALLVVLSAFWGVRGGLCCLGALRGLCGFCARVELGGLKACGVFASILSSFVLFLVLYFVLFLVLLLLCLPFFLSSLLLLLSLFLPSLLVLLSSACPLVCLVCSCVIVGFVFSFSLSDYTQKERARRVGASSLVLLWVALFGCCFIFLVLVWCQPVYIIIEF